MGTTWKRSHWGITCRTSGPECSVLDDCPRPGGSDVFVEKKKVGLTRGKKYLLGAKTRRHFTLGNTPYVVQLDQGYKARWGER
jgi:hypothetical protein